VFFVCMFDYKGGCAVNDEYRAGYHGEFAGKTGRPERRRFGRSALPAESAGEGGELVACRGASPYVWLVAFVLLLVFSTTLLDLGVAAAQSPDVLEAGGRDLGIRDWLDHLLLALGAALLVVVVDALVVFKIVRDRRGSR
jgi:hypothetical protein